MNEVFIADPNDYAHEIAQYAADRNSGNTFVADPNDYIEEIIACAEHRKALAG